MKQRYRIIIQILYNILTQYHGVLTIKRVESNRGSNPKERLSGEGEHPLEPEELRLPGIGGGYYSAELSVNPDEIKGGEFPVSYKGAIFETEFRATEPFEYFSEPKGVTWLDEIADSPWNSPKYAGSIAENLTDLGVETGVATKLGQLRQDINLVSLTEGGMEDIKVGIIPEDSGKVRVFVAYLGSSSIVKYKSFLVKGAE